MQVNVRSTDVDRTLMSGGALLSALYPPDNSQVSNFKNRLYLQIIVFFRGLMTQ